MIQERSKLVATGYRWLILTALVFITAGSGYAQFKPADYSRTEAMIPMRDGVKLYTTGRRSRALN